MRFSLLRVKRPLSLALLLFSVVVAKASQDPEMVRKFDYDKSAPLELKTLKTEKRGEANVHDITYASPKGGVVTAYLVVPAKGKGPFAGVIWGHWYWRNSEMRNRKQFLDEAVVLASAGVVSLLTDGPVARPGYVPDTTLLNDKQFADLLQQVLDMRRGVDLLTARKDVDPKRLAYVGHSYNASVGGILSGVERRFKAFVLMAGPLSDEIDLKSGIYKQYREQAGPERFDAYWKKYSYLDQGRYVAHAAPAIVFMQYAMQEQFLTPDRARAYAEIVSEPKRFKLYDAPHSLNAEARRDRIAFLTEVLKLKQLSAAAINSIPDLYQPPRN